MSKARELAELADTVEVDGTGTIVSPGGSAFVGTVATGSTNGAIIERGSNANGEFVKFADGTMICLVETALTQSAINGRFQMTYPSAFSDATSNFRVAAGSEDQPDSFTRFYNTTSVTTEFSNTYLQAYLGVSTLSYPIRYMVIGRWF